MPLFNKDNRKSRQDARLLRRKLKGETKASNQALRIQNRGNLFSQVGGIVSSLSSGASENSPVTAGTKELAIAQNADGSTDLMGTLKNFAPVLAIGGVVLYLAMNKKKKRR